MGNRGLLSFGLAGLCGIAAATPTSLIMLPVADILGHREVSVNTTAVGFEKSVDPKTYWTGGLTIGLFDRVELGVDTDFEGGRLNDIKVNFLEDEKLGLAFSGGFMNISQRDRTIDKYLVARKDFKGFRLHAGYLYSDMHRGFVGADFELPNGYSAAVEHLGGPNSVTWVALNVPLKLAKQEICLTLAGGFPSVKADGNQWMVSAAYGFRF